MGSPTGFNAPRCTYNERQSNPLPQAEDCAEDNGTPARGGESYDGLREVGSVWKRLEQNGQHVSAMIARHVWMKNEALQGWKWGHEEEEKKTAMPSEVGTKRDWPGQWIFIVLPSQCRLGARSDLHTSVPPSLSCIAERHSIQLNFSLPRRSLFPRHRCARVFQGEVWNHAIYMEEVDEKAKEGKTIERPVTA